MKRLIIILGMHRSGTSVVTQICQCMGAYLGEQDELMVGTEDNPAGFFENNEIVRINNEVLCYHNRGWYSLESLEVDFHSSQVMKSMRELESIIRKLFEKSNIVGIKDPRIAVLLPLWEKIIDELKVEVNYIWEFRNPLEVADSLRKRNGYSKKHSLLLWAHYNLNILNFLNGKNYLLINYRDLLNNTEVFRDLGQLFDRKAGENLNKKFNSIVRQEYCHSDHSCQMIPDQVVSEIYDALLMKKEQDADGTIWNKWYMEEIERMGGRYIDYEVLEDRKYLESKQIIIYGAGNYGRKAAEMLQQIGGSKFDFCDKDDKKHGMNIMGGKVFSITEIEETENLLVIIAVADEEVKKQIEQTLRFMKGVTFLSFFALELVWKYLTNDEMSMASKAEIFSCWHSELASRGALIKNACKCPILVYQGGKVGSTTISVSLRAVGIENAHIHHFFYKSDYIGELLLGDEQRDFVKGFNISQFQSPEYVKGIKNEMKNKKIISLVRDPVAADLSSVFQWIGRGVSDRYFAKQFKQGKTFSQIITDLMVRIQNRLFNWFDEELKELCGIDVLDYPFDREKGYTIISENTFDILILKVEKLSQMTEVIRNFTGSHQIELVSKNLGREKGYAYIYDEAKKRLEIPREYMEHYYNNNPYMDLFYSEEEKNNFLRKWMERENTERIFK